jgi:regulator of sigma E protease
MKIAAIVLVFGALVFFHELGHLLLAKRAGILCREFALGMGPKLFSFKRGETVYTLRLFPIGGFVRMAGEDPEIVKINQGQEISFTQENGKITELIVGQQNGSGKTEKVTVESIDLEHRLLLEAYVDGELKKWKIDPKAHILYNDQKIQIAPWDRQFGGKTVGQRAAAIFAGPIANFILAFVLLTGMAAFYGTPINQPVLGKISEGGPAYKAKLMEGDQVLKINNQAMNSWEDIVKVVSTSPQKKLAFTIQRGAQVTTIPVVTESVGNVGKIGVYQPASKNVMLALKYGGQTTWDFSTMIFKGLGMLVSGHVAMNELSGPVGIFNMTYEAADKGISILLKWAAILSVNLGIINLLPLPALDGGRLVFLGVEALRGKPVDPQKEGFVHFLGFAFLMLLILVITWNDIQKFFF